MSRGLEVCLAIRAQPLFFEPKNIIYYFPVSRLRTPVRESILEKNSKRRMMEEILLPSLPEFAGKRLSDKCRYIDDELARCILVNGIPLYLYDLADKVAERHVCVNLYRNGLATQLELADALNVTGRTVRNWVRNYRDKGAAGLVDKPRPGAPKKLTEEVKKKIKIYRRERMKVTDIAQVMNLSLGTVCEFLYSSKRKSPELFVEDEPPVCDRGVDLCESQSKGVIEEVGDLVVIADKDSARAAENTSECRVDEPAQYDNSNEQSAKQSSATFSGSVVDPLDRSSDRMAAIFGLIEDASPVFVTPGRTDRIEFAGAFLAVALLQNDPYLRVSKEVYRSFGASFYGIRSLFMTLVLMALLRIKNCERVESYNPEKLGRILGLDRSPCVKTLRSKLAFLALRNSASTFMKRLAEERIRLSDAPLVSVYIDGHVKKYYGKFKIGKTYSATLNKVVKGSTDYWLNLADGTPLICVQCQFNEGMTKVLTDILKDAKTLYRDQNPIIIFDRGGYSAKLFEELINAGYKLITYRKNGKKINESLFKKGKTKINAKRYDYQPYEHDIKLDIYESKQSKTGNEYRACTGRTVDIREIRILREDRGQTAILTNLTKEEMSAIETAGNLFSRWTQENFLKYMIKEYNLDHLCCYGTESLDPSIDHPNPEYSRLVKQSGELSKKIGALLRKKAETLTAENTKEAQKELQKLKKNRDGKKIAMLLKTAKEVKSLLAKIPKRVSANDYRRLKPEIKHLSNAIKISAYHIETKLVKLLEIYYKKTAKDGRSIIVAALHSSGSIKIRSNCLMVSIEKQATPKKTRLIQSLCEQMNKMKAKYPGSDLTLYFDVDS